MKRSLHFAMATCCIMAALQFFFSLKLNGQTWSFRGGYGTTSSGTDRANAATTDAAGNIYITGTYTGATNFGMGGLNMANGSDGFVAKFDANGVCQWSMRFGGSGANVDQGTAIATDGTNVYVAGTFFSSVTVGSSTIMNSAGGVDGLIFQLDANTGTVGWINTYGGSNGENAQGLCLDAAGNLYLTGNFFGSASFDGFTRTATGGSGSDLFVAKIDGSTGAFTWVSSGGSSSANDNQGGAGICYVPGLNEVIVTGSFSGANAIYTTVSPATNISLTLGLGTSADICVLELDASTGAFVDGTSVGGLGAEEGLGIAYDPTTQDAILTGYFNSTLLLFSGNTIVNGGGDDVFFTRYDPNSNNFVWARSASGTSGDRALAISANGNGGAWITGRFRNTLNADDGSGIISVTSPRSNGEDLFLMKANTASGDVSVLTGSQGDNLNTITNLGAGVAYAPGGKVWVTGTYASNITFGSLPTLSPSGASTADAMLARYDDVTLPVKLQTFTAELMDKDVQLKWQTESEISHDYFDVERSLDGRSFTPVGRRQSQHAVASANYSLTDIDIASQGVSKIYYRLRMVSMDGRSDYSATVIVYLNAKSSLLVKVLPNPFTATLSVSLNMPRNGKVQVSVIDLSGRRLLTQQRDVAKGFSTLPVDGVDKLSKGTYMLVMEVNGEKVVSKITKQ